MERSVVATVASFCLLALCLLRPAEATSITFNFKGTVTDDAGHNFFFGRLYGD